MRVIAWRCPLASGKAKRRSGVSRARLPAVASTESTEQHPSHSPFAEAVVHRKVDEPSRDNALEMNVENVNKVLDEV